MATSTQKETADTETATAKAKAAARPAPSGASARSANDAQQVGPRLSFETSELKSSYCNVCNATSTREEVVLNFGINESWDRDVGDMTVRLQHRIIVSPYAAKRLLELLQKLLAEHEARYGELK